MITAAVEIFDSATMQWSLKTSMPAANTAFAVTLLPNGLVFVCGGTWATPNGAMTYNPATDTWHVLANMQAARYGHTATALSSGKVLIVGGDSTPSAELYDPAAGTNGQSVSLGFLTIGQKDSTATLLADGNVLVAGGYTGDCQGSACSRRGFEMIYKRGGTWHADFSVNGHRYRKSLGTTDWREAQSKEKDLITQASAGKIAISNQNFARLSFTEAAERYLMDRKPHLAEKSISTEAERVKPLNKYFESRPVSSLAADDLRAYISSRHAAKISNKTINLELEIVRGVLKRAKRWHLVSDEIKPLPVQHRMNEALTESVKVHLAEVAAGKPAWENAFLAMTLALNTTMRSCEIKGLRWRHINFFDKALTIYRRTTKTSGGFMDGSE